MGEGGGGGWEKGGERWGGGLGKRVWVSAYCVAPGFVDEKGQRKCGIKLICTMPG